MRNLLLYLTLSITLASCGGLDLPKVEESKLNIDKYTIQYVELKKQIALKVGDKKQKEDVAIQIKTSVINNLMDKFANASDSDVKMNFLQTNEIYSESKSTLGINYKNYVNLEKGLLDLNLKKVRLESNDNNKIIGLLELEGKGKVKVNGKYLAVPVSAEPDIVLYLNDQFNFEAKSINGKMFLAPEKKNVLLKTKISIKLLEWSIPYYKEIPLEVAELIKPLELPLASQSEILFPMPAKKFGDSKVEFVPLGIELNNTSLSSTKDYLKINTNLNFKAKQQ